MYNLTLPISYRQLSNALSGGDSGASIHEGKKKGGEKKTGRIRTGERWNLGQVLAEDNSYFLNGAITFLAAVLTFCHSNYCQHKPLLYLYLI